MAQDRYGREALDRDRHARIDTTRSRLRRVPLPLAVAGALLLAGPAIAASPSPVPVIALPIPDGAPLADGFVLPAGARLAYVVGADSRDPVVHVVAADGSGDSKVGAGSGPDWQSPTFASGDVLAFDCPGDGKDAGSAICLDELGAYWHTTLLQDARDPRWSPTGEALAFIRANGDPGEAWVTDLSEFHPRTSDQIVGPTRQLPGGDPQWSPTGDRLLVAGGGAVPVLSTVRLDGTDARTVGEGEHGTWSPDGRRVAFTSWDGDRTSIMASSVLTGASDVLAAIPSRVAALRWLPGDGLAIVAENDDTGTGDLYVVELSDGSVHSLTSGLAVGPDLSVSPDGAWIAFGAEDEDGKDIYVAAREGGWRRVTETGDASMPAWGSFRPTLEPGAFIQSSVNRLRMRSRPWIGDDSARYEPLLSQAYVLEVLEGPVAGSGYWWYRVRLADWEDLRLRDGKRSGIRSGWVAVADHAGRAWIGGVDVDPGTRQPSLRTGWPVAHRDGLRLRGSTPSLEADGSIVTEATVTGLHPGTALTLIAEGDSETVWRCEPTQAGSNDGDTGTASPITSSARSWADVSVGGDGTGRATLRLLPSPAAVGLCPSGTPVAEVRWTDVHVSDPLHRLELHPKPVSNVPDR